jgi:branched-chain amino acid transport system substrate-binding protein
MLLGCKKQSEKEEKMERGQKRCFQQVVFLIAAIFLLGLTAGSADAAQKTQTKQPIKIGVVSPVSGNYADMGVLERIGMEMALEDYNYEVLGRPVTLIVADDETNPDVAARRARRLAEVDGVKFLMGGVSTSTALSVGAVAEEKKVLFIATNQNGDQVTGESARRYVFRTPPDMAILVRAGAKYVADNLGKKWFFLTHDYSWGHSGTKWARNMLGKVGAKEVGEIKVPMGNRDFSSQLLTIRNSDADVLVITVSGFDNVSLLKQMNEYKIYDKMKVWYTLMDVVDLFSVPVEDRQAYVCAEMYYRASPEMEKLNERYQKKYPRAASPVLDTATYNGWLSMKMLLEAIKKAKTADDVEKVICAMEGLTIKDNARKTPSYVRPWDHQVLTEVVFGKVNPVQGNDILDVKASIPADQVARTKEENPVNIGCKK